MNIALLLVDFQNDYFPGGKMELYKSTEASLNARVILEFFRDKKMPIVHMQHFSSYRGAVFFVPGTDGVKIHYNVTPLANEKVIEKNYPNSFRETKLLENLKFNNIKKIVICGMMTHMCIDASARASFDYGFENIILKDACATKALVFENTTIPAELVHYSFLSALNNTYGKVLSTDDAIKTLKTSLKRDAP